MKGMSSVFLQEQLQDAVEMTMPGEKIETFVSRGKWMRYNYEIKLASGRVVFMKIDPPGDTSAMSAKEDYINSLLKSYGLPAPKTLGLDDRGQALGTPFIIQEKIGGIRLGNLMKSSSSEERKDLYRCMGRFYRRLHDIRSEKSGWINGPGEVLPFSPNDYMYREVVLNNGAIAVERGVLDTELYERLKQLLSENLAYLKEHDPVLVSGPLPWSIYFQKTDDEFRVTKLTDVHDCLWWDRAWDISAICYPSFMEVEQECIDAFEEEYGVQPDEKRIKLYRLMRCIDACIGMYFEPKTPEHEQWRAKTIRELPTYIEDIERNASDV